MNTAAYKVDIASDRRRHENVPRYILCSEKLQKIARNSKLWDMQVYYYENELEDEFNAFDNFVIQLAFEQAKLKKKDVPCNPGRQLYRISGILRSVNAPLQHTAVKL